MLSSASTVAPAISPAMSKPFQNALKLPATMPERTLRKNSVSGFKTMRVSPDLSPNS